MLLTCGRAVGGTAVAVAGYSLTGLAATIVLGRRPTWLAPLGLGASAAGFVLMVALIWTSPSGGLLPKVTMSVLILAVVIAHAALVLPRRANPPAAGAVLRATLATSSVLAAMLIALILLATEPGEFYFRLPEGRERRRGREPGPRLGSQEWCRS